MVLRKDIQIVAWLILKRIDFNPLIKTVEVDESKLSEDVVFKLREYETDPEPFRRMPYKKIAEKPVIVNVKPPKKKKELPVKKPKDFHIMLRRSPKVDIDKAVRFYENKHQLPPDYQRPKGEYSNPQYNDL